MAAIVLGAVVVVAVQPRPAGPAATGDNGPVAPVAPLIVSAAYVPAATQGGRAVVDQPVAVSAHALGEAGVAALELWDGPELVAVKESDPASPSPAFYARWSWVPVHAGQHTLFVRGVDLQGRVVQSNAVRVEVAAEATLPELGRFSAARPIAFTGSGLQIRSGAARPAAPAYGIAVPTLAATLDGCQLELAVSDAPAVATGLRVHGLSPSGANFMPLLTMAPKSDAQQVGVTLVGAGQFVFSASAFDQAVEAYSPPVEVNAPADCATTGWSGEVSLVGGRLTTGQIVDRAYIYLTQTGGAAVRVPSIQGKFVEAGPDGVVDFAPLLPALGGSAFTIEAWGWKDGTLVSLGSGAFAPPPAPPGGGGNTGGGTTAGGPMTFGGGAPELAGGALTTLHVATPTWVTGSASPDDDCAKEFCLVDQYGLSATIERPPVGSTKPILRKFRWTTILPDVSQFAWQILPYPPANTGDLAPPFLIDQGMIPVASGQTEGDFSLDFAKYFKAGVPTASLGETPQNLAMGPIFGAVTSPDKATMPTPAPATGGAANEFSLVKGSLDKMFAFNDRFYVRLVPIQGNSAMLPSNPVTLDVVEPAAPIQITDPNAGEGVNQNSYTISWTYTPPVGADYHYTRCAVVKAVSPSVSPPHVASFYKGYLASGKPLCYSPPKDSGWSPLDAFDAFVEFVSDVWDFVGDAYEDIKQAVVDIVLVAVPCKQVASDAVCEQIAMTALEVALASVGVPPSLPNFDSVVAGLKGDLATLVVEAAGAIPGVAEACGMADTANTVTSKVQTCEELAGAAIDAMIKQVEAAQSQAAGQASGFGWPGVTLAPDPRGIYHAPTFSLKITRTNEPGLPKTCSVSASMKSFRNGWTFPELHQGYPKQITADVSGQPLLGSSTLIPPLQAGQSIERQLWLTKPFKWFESWRAELYWNYYMGMLNTNFPGRGWVLLTAGAELTFSVNSNCAKPSQQGPYVLPASAYD
jgi:hypothetical protein